MVPISEPKSWLPPALYIERAYIYKLLVSVWVVILAHNMSEAAIKSVMGEFSTECISLRQALWKTQSMIVNYMMYWLMQFE